MSSPVIALEKVSLTLMGNAGPVNILRDISLKVESGETLGLVGPSGSGKSSLLMLMGGLEGATSGRVTALGQDLTAMNEDALARFRRGNMGVVFQSFHLIPTMTAIENVATPLELAGASDAFDRARIELEAVGLGSRRDHYPAQMSGGEQQRVALARAAATRPRILLADEPTGNLDGGTGEAIMRLLFDLRDRHGATLVLVTHAAELAARCDRVMRLRDGALDGYAEAAGMISPATFRVAFRLALRELRGGLRGFYVLLACLALGVAAIAAVGTVRTAIERGLDRESARLLGGDAEMEFAYRYANDAERAWMAEKALAVSEIVDFRSMVTTVPGDGAQAERGLVQVKGVDGAYPLVGQVRLAGGETLAEALAPRDGRPGLVAQAILLDRLGLAPGDVVTLGTQEFRIADRIEEEPDSGSGGFTLGPRVIVRLPDLASSGLLTEGSIFNAAYRLRLAPEASLPALQTEARERFADDGLQWKDRRNATPSLQRFVDRLGAFLVLIGLAGLAVGGVGVGSAVRAHLEGKKETIATLRTLGASSDTIFLVYFLQIGLVAALGIGLGLILGAGAPLALAPLIESRLPLPTAFALYPRPLLEAAIYGGMTALIFTLWPLARARDIRAAELFRDIDGPRRWPAPVFIAATLALIVALVALATRLSGDPELALTTAAGVLFALALLFLAALGLRALARWLARGEMTRGRPALRWALAALGGPSGETAPVVLSLGLGLAVLAGIGQIDTNLRHLISAELPARAPAFFFVDIQNDQLPGFLETAEAVPGVARVETAPMLRGVITRINGVPAREAVGHGHWALAGDRGITYAATPPEGTAITEGEWWPEDYTGPPRMSFAEEEGRELGLKLGDEVTVNVLGRDVTAEITSFRRVEFRSMGINFLMVVDPAALAGAPRTHIATVYAGPEAEAPLLRAVTTDAPNITAIGVRDAVEQASGAMNSISAATRWGASATLLTGLIVLIGAAASGQRARIYESAVLKTLGATRAHVLASFALRSALIGAAAGLVAILAGAVAGWWVTTRVMEASYTFAPLSALAIVAGGALASLLAGLAFALAPLRAKPARILRARD